MNEFNLKNVIKINSEYMPQKDITFIIPSVGRPTLIRTLVSLQNLTIPYWKAIVVFDGVDGVDRIDDNRISYISIPKTGVSNHAGNVRNIAIEKADTTWIAFVDDDDSLTPDYLEEFYKISDKQDPDVIIFRMIYPANYERSPGESLRIIPTLNTNNIIRLYDVGISFCIKKCKNIEKYFEPSGCEDFIILKKLNDMNKAIVLSEKVCYKVGH